MTELQQNQLGPEGKMIRGGKISTAGAARLAQVFLEESQAQAGVMFRALKERKGLWVPLPELGRLAQCRCVATCISWMRQKGCVIENKQEIVEVGAALEGGVRKSWYRLLKEPRETAAEMD